MASMISFAWKLVKETLRFRFQAGKYHRLNQALITTSSNKCNANINTHIIPTEPEAAPDNKPRLKNQQYAARRLYHSHANKMSALTLSVM